MAPVYKPHLPHDMLTQWVVQHGGHVHEDVEVLFSSEKGYHLVVKLNAKLEPNTQVLACPVSCTMSILNVLETEGGFTCGGLQMPPAFIQKQPRENVERFFLMAHYLAGKRSWWVPYIDTLPTPEEVRQSQFETPDDLAWIRGTNLALAFDKQAKHWKQLHEQGMEQLLELQWPSARRLTGELYHWASTIFTSRAFTSKVLSESLPAKRIYSTEMSSCSQTTDFCNGPVDEHGDYQHLTNLFSEGFPVLVPVLDVLNYRPLAQVEWQAGPSLVGLEVLEPIQSDGEVCNNYGPRDNETLLLGYGFTVQNNPFDHFSVTVRLPEGLSLAKLRTPPPAENGQDVELKCYVFKPEHPCATEAKSFETALFSLDLLDTISALCATDREWQAMHSSGKTYFAQSLRRGCFEDSRNLLATLSQLLLECQARLKALESGAKALLAPTNLKQKFAKNYRSGLVEILQIAVLHCRFILRRAIAQDLGVQPHDDDMHFMYNIGIMWFVNPDQLLRLQTLLQQHKCISMPNELYSFDDLLDLLPTLASSLSDVMSELEEEISQHTAMEDEMNAYQMCKMEFSLALSAMLAEHMKNCLEPARLKSWLGQLTQWYPPDDPNWCHVPDRGSMEPEETASSPLLHLLDAASEVLRKGSCLEGTSAWLQPERIAWAWNVMEEEGVSVPSDVLDDPEVTHDPNEMTFLLYIPQLTDQTLQQS